MFWDPPFRSEAKAYRFLVVTIAYFAASVVASLLGGREAGLAVFIGLAATGLTWLLWRSRGVRPAPRMFSLSGAGERRVLVIANETVTSEPLREEIRRAASGGAEVLIVCPALNSRLRHWASDDSGARAGAQKRLDESLDHLRRAGIDARGEIGDSNPLQAIEDALRAFGASEIIISTHPEGRSNWLERGVVSAARERFNVSITHVTEGTTRLSG